MTLQEQVNQQRVQHIVSSYQLDGAEPAFNLALGRLLEDYATPVLELALAETLVANWLLLPLPRGMAFMQQVRDRLDQWEQVGIDCHLSPDAFYQVTGLDPLVVFRALDPPMVQSCS
jgi:hypothetical protein